MTSAAVVQETDISVTSTTVPVRIDSPVLANRYWIRVINPQTTLRIFIGHSSAMTNQTNSEVIDPYSGVWEDAINPNIQIWALAETGATLPVSIRVKQYA